LRLLLAAEALDFVTVDRGRHLGSLVDALLSGFRLDSSGTFSTTESAEHTPRHVARTRESRA
jgi:hypothetical protein